MVLLRVRTNVGLWRVNDVDASTATVQDVIDAIKVTRPGVVFEQMLSLDPAGRKPLVPHQTLAEQGIEHGSMIHCRVDPETCFDVRRNDAEAPGNSPPVSGNAPPGAMRKIIGKNGQIKWVPSNETIDPKQDKGFRKGMMALRDMKSR